MDIKNILEHRTDYFTKHNYSGSQAYNYEEEGILRRCLPRILFHGNTLLTTFLQLIDMEIIMTLKYIDRLKAFKYITRYH